MTQDQVRVDWESLTEFTKEVFVRVGLPAEDAQIEAEVLVWANLRGVDSHGVFRIPLYLDWLRDGIFNATPNIQVVKETPATIVMDADRAFGPVVTTMAMRRVIDKARAVGIGWGYIRHTSHQGAMGYYSLMAAKEDMAGIAIVCGAPNMAPTGARAVGVSNNPIAIAVPGNRHSPMILDMATSVAAGGKVSLAVDKGIPIPEGWALDEDGRSTTDPTQAKVFLPFSGPKGSGLALMFECITSLMVGSPLLEPVLAGKPELPRGVQNSVIAAIDIGTFTDVAAYKEHVDGVIAGLKALPKSEGTDEILTPGELEDGVYKERSERGIPLAAGTVSNLQAVADRFKIKMPRTV